VQVVHICSAFACADAIASFKVLECGAVACADAFRVQHLRTRGSQRLPWPIDRLSDLAVDGCYAANGWRGRQYRAQPATTCALKRPAAPPAALRRPSLQPLQSRPPPMRCRWRFCCSTCDSCACDVRALRSAEAAEVRRNALQFFELEDGAPF
jgi:hypothetical protein